MFSSSIEACCWLALKTARNSAGLVTCQSCPEWRSRCTLAGSKLTRRTEFASLDASLKSLFSTRLYAAQFMRLLLRTYSELRDSYFAPCKPLPTPSTVLQATASYIEEQNPVALWLRENYDITEGTDDYFVTADALREQYNSTRPRLDQLSRKAFKDAMAMAGLTSAKASRGPAKSMMTYFGLQLKKAPVDL